MRLRLAALATLPLASCGLIKLPFKVAGAVVEGGAYVGKKAYDASADALTKSDEEKAAAAEKKARKQAAKEAKDPAAKPDAKPAEPEMLPEAPAEPTPPVEPELPVPAGY
jgi:hypothetical protein